MTHAEALTWLRGERSTTNMIPRDPYDTWLVRTAEANAAMTTQAYWIARAHRDGLCATEETRDVQDSCTTPEVVRRVPQPLTNDELQGLGWGYIGAGAMKEDGLGIYRISEVEEACK